MAEYDVPLFLTTPHMRGMAVRDAQWLLSGHSRFGSELAPYKHGRIDSEYGPLTAQATVRAKYWLGYPERAVDEAFGQTLYEYLRQERWRPLPALFQRRRRARLQQITPGFRALREAAKWVGYRETPAGSNHTVFGVEYGFDRVPWCAIFESIMFKHSGWKKFHYAAVSQIYWSARARRDGLRLVFDPQPGDVVGYRRRGDPFAHTAFFDHWVDQDRGTFMDLGGNTSVTDMANGGEVARQGRSIDQVTFYCRVG